MGQFRTLLFTVIGLTLLGGTARLLLDSPRLPPVSLSRALDWAGCLAATDIPAGTTVTLVSLAPRNKGRDAVRDPGLLVDRLGFIAATPVQIEPDVAAERASVERGEQVAWKAGREVRVKQGEFALENGAVELHKGDGRLLLRARDRVRFAPAADASYVITLAEAVIVGGKDGAGKPLPVTLPAGTRGSLRLGDGQAATLSPLQPLVVRPWLFETASSLLPERASGRSGLADLAIEARRSGLQFDSADVRLSACALTKDGIVSTVGVADVKPGQTGAATVLLSLSGSLLPVFSSFWTPVELAVATADGRYAGLGGFAAIGRGWAAILATLLTVALFWWLATIRNDELDKDKAARKNDNARWFASLFIGADKEASLSLFQVFFWTAVTVWGFVYVFTVTGSLLSMTTEMMVLLGIAGVGSVAARWIALSRAPASGLTLPDPVAKAEPEHLYFWHILSTGKQFDLLKLQLFVFTLLIGAYVVWRILDSAAFPTLDTNTLLLLGVSQSVYIGGKLAATTDLGQAQALKLELETYNSALQNAQDKKRSLTSADPGADTTKSDSEIENLEAKIGATKAALQEVVRRLGLTPA